VAGERDTDGRDNASATDAADPRSTMRFIPSGEIPAFASWWGGPTGLHTLYVAARNDPIVYSVEVVRGRVTPTDRPLELRGSHGVDGDHCATEDPLLVDRVDPVERQVCHFQDPADTVRVETGSFAGDKVIQIVAQAGPDEDEVCLRPPVERPVGSGNWVCDVGGADRQAAEGIRVRRGPLGIAVLGAEYIVGNETKFGAFHGYPMMGNAYVLRMERFLTPSLDFYVDTNDSPFYHHVVAWQRQGPTLAALYYPLIRGLNMTPFMLYPEGDTFGLSVDTTVADSPDVNVVAYCEDASGWYRFLDFSAAPGFVASWPLRCTRVMFLVGMMAPAVDAGQVLEVGLWG
jgi:hypothetical protein